MRTHHEENHVPRFTLKLFVGICSQTSDQDCDICVLKLMKTVPMGVLALELAIIPIKD